MSPDEEEAAAAEEVEEANEESVELGPPGAHRAGFVRVRELARRDRGGDEAREPRRREEEEAEAEADAVEEGRRRLLPLVPRRVVEADFAGGGGSRPRLRSLASLRAMLDWRRSS